MVENPNTFAGQIDWSSINKASFYPTRGDVSSESNEATIYSRRDLRFVIKEFTDPKTIQTYLQTGVNLKGLVPEMTSYENIVIRVNNRSTRLNHCIIQQKSRH